MPLTTQSTIDSRRSSQRGAALACGEDEIWNASQIQERPPWGTARGFTYPPGSDDPRFFVKFTRIRSKWLLEPEKRNHEFAFNILRKLGPYQPASQQLKLLVCVPEIFRAFEYRECYFLVMEYIPGRTLDELLYGKDIQGGAEVQEDSSMLYQYIAEGIRLLSVKAPPGAKPGPVGGGIIRHPFFNDFHASVPYRDIEMLEIHLNKVIKQRLRNSPNPIPILTLERELEFYYADLYSGNFMFIKAGDYTILYIIDFDAAGFLPHSFMAFVLHNHIHPVAEKIVHLIKHKTDNLKVMSMAGSFVLSSSNHIGLPLEGYPETEGDLNRYLS